jgi:hypothetical protein
MAHFLLIYDRDAGEIIRKQRYEHRSDAMEARFRGEQEFAGRPEIEIVALAAESEQDLMRTHARYFLGLTQLADRMAWRAPPAPARAAGSRRASPA